MFSVRILHFSCFHISSSSATVSILILGKFELLYILNMQMYLFTLRSVDLTKLALAKILFFCHIPLTFVSRQSDLYWVFCHLLLGKDYRNGLVSNKELFLTIIHVTNIISPPPSVYMYTFRELSKTKAFYGMYMGGGIGRGWNLYGSKSALPRKLLCFGCEGSEVWREILWVLQL